MIIGILTDWTRRSNKLERLWLLAKIEFKLRYYELILFAVANPIYWLMHSISAYKGLYQLVVKPFYWEKTNHGLSKVNNPVNVVEQTV